jgi:hypothetical protein
VVPLVLVGRGSVLRRPIYLGIEMMSSCWARAELVPQAGTRPATVPPPAERCSYKETRSNVRGEL